MRVRLLHFASFRDAAGRDEEVRELPEGTRVAELWAALCPRGRPLLADFPRCRRPP